MSLNEDRAKFQDIEDFLKALATGIVEGNKALEEVQTPAASKFGTLVVKEGEISTQFEISSLAMKAGAEVPHLGLGVRTIQQLPFVGVVTENNRRVSEAKITLKLVRVAPTPEEPPVEKRVLEPNLTVLDTGRPLGPISTGPSRGERHGEPIPSTPSPGETAHSSAGGALSSGASQPPSTPVRPAAGTVQPPTAAARPAAPQPQSPASAPQPRRTGGRAREGRVPPSGGSGEERRQPPSKPDTSAGPAMPPEMRQAAAVALRNALATLSLQVPFILVSEQQRRLIIADLDRVGTLLEKGNIEAATQAFAQFAQQYGAVFGAT